MSLLLFFRTHVFGVSVPNFVKLTTLTYAAPSVTGLDYTPDA